MRGLDGRPAGYKVAGYRKLETVAKQRYRASRNKHCDTLPESRRLLENAH